jgi:hypothetical protein
VTEPRLPHGIAFAWLMIAALICWAFILAIWLFF